MFRNGIDGARESPPSANSPNRFRPVKSLITQHGTVTHRKRFRADEDLATGVHNDGAELRNRTRERS